MEVILGDYVDVAETKEVQGISTRSGKELKHADLIVRLHFSETKLMTYTLQVQTRGTRPNTEFVAASIGAASLSSNGLIRVRPTLQLVDYDNIFAAGDIIDWKEQKQAPKARTHGEIAAANVLAIIQKRPLKPYKGSTEMIVITNGKACIFTPISIFILGILTDVGTGWWVELFRCVVGNHAWQLVFTIRKV